jgi:uncharacterized protein (TIGR02145 family)
MYKNQILLFISFLFILGCSKSSDIKSNPTTAIVPVVPVAPSKLIGAVVSSFQINLSWTDNSSNETGFKIERRTSNSTNYSTINTNANVNTYLDGGLSPITTYVYRVYSYNSAGNSPYSNEVTIGTAVLPTLTTTTVSSIATGTAVSGGTILSDGRAAITTKGVCWSTGANPTIALSAETNNGFGTAAFVSNISGLASNTTYYVRAYATNSVGTGYGNEVSFKTASPPPTITVTDIDGNTYQTVTICNQIWTKSNLKVSKYRNGDVIPQVTDATQWVALTTGAWCYYANTTSNGTTYGKLYNWYAVNDSRGLAPIGYHIPSDAEWTTLTTCLAGAGGKMKELGTLNAGTGHWIQPNTGATNSSGFSGLPAGVRSAAIGTFQLINLQSYWWSSTQGGNGTIGAWVRWLSYDVSGIGSGSGNKQGGYSVRCIKD